MNQGTAQAKRRRWLKAAVGLVVMMSMAARVFADTIVLKNGRTIEGTIVEETAQRVVVRVGLLTTEFRPSEIEEIRRSPSRSEDRSASGRRAVGTRAASGSVRGQLTQNSDVLLIQDAIAIHYCPDGPLEVTFLPFRLSAEDLSELRGGKSAFQLVGGKPNPNPSKWPACPYIHLQMKLPCGMDLGPENVDDYHFVIYETIYETLSFVFDETGPKARQAIPSLNLTMQGEEGTLQIAFSGNATHTYDINPRFPTDYRYSWSFRGQCAVLTR